MVLGSSAGRGPAGYVLRQSCGDFQSVMNALDIWGQSEELVGGLAVPWPPQPIPFTAAVVCGAVLVGWGGCCCKRMFTVFSPPSFVSFRDVCKHFPFATCFCGRASAFHLMAGFCTPVILPVTPTKKPSLCHSPPNGFFKKTLSTEELRLQLLSPLVISLKGLL